jgi:hypothetical protein
LGACLLLLFYCLLFIVYLIVYFIYVYFGQLFEYFINNPDFSAFLSQGNFFVTIFYILGDVFSNSSGHPDESKFLIYNKETLPLNHFKVVFETLNFGGKKSEDGCGDTDHSNPLSHHKQKVIPGLPDFSR